jgi:hypothetical protein
MFARKLLFAALARRASSVARVSARSSEVRYAGMAIRPTSRPQASAWFASQYGVVVITLRNDTVASATATSR